MLAFGSRYHFQAKITFRKNLKSRKYNYFKIKVKMILYN